MQRNTDERRAAKTWLIRACLDRARAYNGACTTLVTRDGTPIAAASGAMRTGRPVSFPTRTRPVTDILPDIDEYTGLPLDDGRMGATASDPKVQQQYSMVAGSAGAGHVNGLSTLNIRGERSVTCQAACDAPVASGPLPASCPAACDEFRRQPDALELDAVPGDATIDARLRAKGAIIYAKANLDEYNAARRVVQGRADRFILESADINRIGHE